MSNPFARFSRSAGVAVAASVLGLSACKPPQPDAPAPPTEPAATPNVTLATMGRNEILTALDAAAGAYAAGLEASAMPALTGRTFEVRLPFGCNGPAETATGTPGLAHWRPLQNGVGMTLSVQPADWTRSPLVLDPGAEPTWDAVEGFWIDHPWIRLDVCPRSPEVDDAASAEPAPAEAASGEPVSAEPSVDRADPMTAGLAVIESSEASRAGRRRGESWRHVVRAPADGEASNPDAGPHQLVLAGRVSRFRDGQSVRCRADRVDQRPVCVMAVELDLIAFAGPDGRRLSEWRPGG